MPPSSSTTFCSKWHQLQGQTRFLGCLPHAIWKTYKDGDYTTSPGNLFQYLAVLRGKRPCLMSRQKGNKKSSTKGRLGTCGPAGICKTLRHPKGLTHTGKSTARTIYLWWFLLGAPLEDLVVNSVSSPGPCIKYDRKLIRMKITSYRKTSL